MSPFREPPWDAPLDVAAELRRVPETKTQKSMFITPMILKAKRLGVTLRSARERYLPFQEYPLREHVQLLVESAEAFYPRLNMRQALRRLGRGAYRAFVESTVGKVVWSTVTDAHSSLDAILKGYAIAVPGCTAAVVERSAGRAVVRLDRITYFLDCHHVGCIEGAIHAVGTHGRVTIRLDGPSSGEFLAEW
jgi:uncharacterized protein (TIGR02265 family)